MLGPLDGYQIELNEALQRSPERLEKGVYFIRSLSLCSAIYSLVQRGSLHLQGLQTHALMKLNKSLDKLAEASDATFESMTRAVQLHAIKRPRDARACHQLLEARITKGSVVDAWSMIVSKYSDREARVPNLLKLVRSEKFFIETTYRSSGTRDTRRPLRVDDDIEDIQHPKPTPFDDLRTMSEYLDHQ